MEPTLHDPRDSAFPRLTGADVARAHSDPANLRRAWWSVVARFLIHGLIVSTWVSRIPSVKSDLHLPDGALGMSLLGTAIGSVIGIPICGWLITRYGSRRITWWTSLGFCIALVLPAIAVNATTLFAALFVWGLMAGSNDVAMNSQAVGVEKLMGTPTMSRFHAMFSLGGIAGSVAGGAIASQGVTPFVHLSIAAVILVTLAISTGRLMIDTRTDSAPSHKVKLRGLPMALFALSAIGFCIFLNEGAIADWTGVYLKQVLGAGPGLAAEGYAVFSVAMTIFRLVGDAITLRLGSAWTIRGGGVIAAAGLTWAILVHSPYWALPGFAMAGIGFSSIIPLVFAAGGRIPSIGEGAGVATVSGLGYLGFLVGPPTIGFLSQAFSLRVGLGFVVALSALAALLVTVVERTGGHVALDSRDASSHASRETPAY